MARLLLLRHAKAQWCTPGSGDIDRPLEPSGIEDARRIAIEMRRREWLPDTVRCSHSVRTRQTWQAMSGTLGSPAVGFPETLYHGDAPAYLDVIRAAGTSACLLLIGHNPVMEDLAGALVSRQPETIAAGFPNAGLALVIFEGPLSAIEPGAGRLEAFVTPAGLK